MNNMIREEICTYEVCKLAKEKGFDVPTDFCYEQNGCLVRCGSIAAPTQSLLQRWLREEKEIIVELKYSDNTESFRPFWSWQIYNTLGITLEIGEPNTTYELALEDALKYALENLEETIYKLDGSNIDWEERRYEIAKDILATSHIAQQIGHYHYNEENEVKDAVLMADLLIAELKR